MPLDSLLLFQIFLGKAFIIIIKITQFLYGKTRLIILRSAEAVLLSCRTHLFQKIIEYSDHDMHI